MGASRINRLKYVLHVGAQILERNDRYGMLTETLLDSLRATERHPVFLLPM